MSKQIGILHIGVTVAASVAFVVTWSSGFLVPALAAVEISPLTLLVWRFVPLAVILLAVVGFTGAARGLSAADVRRQALIGLFAQFGYCVAVYGAIASGVATGTTALIDAVQPLIVAVLVGPLLGLRVRAAQWAGLLVGAVGVLLIVRSQLDDSVAHPAALLWPVAAMACLIIGTFLQRRSRPRTGTLVTLTIHVTVTAAVLVPVAAAFEALAPPSSASFWLAAGFAAVFPTLAAYGLYWWLLRRVGITALNALLFLIAPTTALAGAVLLGEPLTIVTLLGFLLCAVGVAAVLVGEARPAGAVDRGSVRVRMRPRRGAGEAAR
ncbi:DMT family transporter [Microbacterium sp. KKR3/1]|uniref:DMT family transporter n=1 Tax=Microbacterium sp. KKR3/1 TaxID=2904241 RepID=UPI001E2C864C|nr:DMT family transporter [Microbacterium sp. KKR3/1]MCE0510065.1 DMT family transporter [Microbacterium sp. KKR3/1]